MPACNKRVAADYRNRGDLKKQRGREKLQGARLAPSFLGDHTRQCRSQPGSQEPGRLRGGVAARGEREHEGETRARCSSLVLLEWHSSQGRGRCSVFATGIACIIRSM